MKSPSERGRTVGWELITPETAAKWLAEHNTRNRNMMPTVVARMADEMKAGRWLETHQGVAFASDGTLADGQHRLAAIVASECPQWMAVARGLDPRVIECIDRHSRRSLAHTLQIMGVGVGNRFASAARAMYFGPATHSGALYVSDSVFLDFTLRHTPAIAFGARCDFFDLGTSVLSGLIARAWYTADHDDLDRIVLLARNQVAYDAGRPGDNSARRLIKIMGPDERPAGTNARAYMYRRAQVALKAFLERRDITRVIETSDDLFPLPKDEAGGE